MSSVMATLRASNSLIFDIDPYPSRMGSICSRRAGDQAMTSDGDLAFPGSPTRFTGAILDDVFEGSSDVSPTTTLSHFARQMRAAAATKADVMKAAASGDLNRVRGLVNERGAYFVVREDRGGLTALWHAADKGRVDVVRYLAGLGADLNAADPNNVTPLMKAAGEGHMDVVRCLAGDYAADVNAVDCNGRTALIKAACEGHLAIVRYLAGDCGADLNASDCNGRSALMEAAGEGRLDVVRYLTKTCGVDGNATGVRRCTALTRAARGGHVDVIRYLVEECGVRVDDTDCCDDANCSGRTALMEAADAGHFDVVRCLVMPYGADVNVRSFMGVSALTMAATRGHFDIVRYLTSDGGAAGDEVDSKGVTTLAKAAAQGHIDIVRYLATNFRVDVNAISDDTGTTALMMAVSRGHTEVVRFLVTECAADVHTADRHGNTALLMAASRGHLAIGRCITRQAPDAVHARDGHGNTALMKAVSTGDVDLVRCLVTEGKADVDSKSSAGTTALKMAVDEGRTDIVRFLARECSADVNSVDDFGFTALWSAVDKGDVGIVRCLAKECAANVNAANAEGTTPLMRAVDRGHINVVRCLAGECKANVNATNENGDTALMLAASKGDTDAVRYLVESCRADVNVRNRKKYTAIQGAVDSGDQEAQRILTSFITAKQTEARAIAVVNYAHSGDMVDSSWYIPPSEVALLKFEQTSNIGGDYRAKWLDSDVAVKIFIPDASSHASFEGEVRLWHQLRHPNVVKLYGACDASPLPLQLFVCEYASNGSLLEYVKSTPPAQQRIWSFLHQAALGLAYLHERGVVHGDLRCSNILIGSDGLSKLANFSRSDQVDKRATLSKAGSIRWQAPEICQGNGMSFASDVYSLGMCILEAVTREMPWKHRCTDRYVNVFRSYWNPEVAYDNWGPWCPPGEARDLIWRMCCKGSDSRVKLAVVVHELEGLAMQESANVNHETTTTGCSIDHDSGEIQELWINVQSRMRNCDNDLYHEAFAELKTIRERLQDGPHSSTVFYQFYKVLRDFRQVITVSREQARVLRLSATRATSSSIIAFRRRLRSLAVALGESTGGTADRKQDVHWDKQRRKQIEIFVSEASRTYLLLEELKSPEERQLFLASLKAEIEHPSLEYTSGQLDVLKEAYEEIASKLDADDLSSLTPRWFIPWYELIIDEYDELGSGGFGSVFRGKWLDSDVVVKLLSSSGDHFTSVSYDSLLESSATNTASATIRTDMMAEFRQEVDIWFGFSHPHVVRLFGACHVGKPLFVCEYATNGTLVSYLRRHPHEVWSKLYEAALGVQYLHARNIVHGDLKGNNIVIGSDQKAKVTDFGLSAITNDSKDPRISAASHWVAPECFSEERARPTFASDIYSLGMCIVEALRVVEAGDDHAKACLPWGFLDNFVAKYHVKQGLLPPRPLCTDEQWGLVQRMCAFEPSKRMKISTVVDELARMANIHVSADTSIKPEHSVPEMITAAQTLLAELHDDTGREGSVLSLYSSLWGRLAQVHSQCKHLQNSTGLADFYSIVREAYEGTKTLQDPTTSLVSLAESVLQCYALQRRLDKLLETNFFPVSASQDSIVFPDSGVTPPLDTCTR